MSKATQARSPENTFLQAVLAAPDDDAPRLIYADWLEERGDPRGEFIRGQCRLARMQEWDDEYVELETRCQLLLRTYREKWLEPLAGLMRADPPWQQASVVFQRGFPGEVAMTPAQFVSRSDRMFALAPIRGLKVWELFSAHAADGFWDCHGLSRIRHLGVSRPFESYPREVLASPRLTATDLTVGSRAVANLPEALASSLLAAVLRRLEINSDGTESGERPSRWSPLWQADTFPRLTRFVFRAAEYERSSSLFPELAAAPWFPRLEWLEFAGGWEPPVEVAPSRLLPAGRLVALTLGRAVRVPRDEAEHFRTMPAVPLQHLDLGSGRGIAGRVLRALLHAPGLAGLRSFSYSGDGNSALAWLCDAPLRESLRALCLYGCWPAGLLRPARAGGPQLTRLRIGFRRELADRRSLAAVLDPAAFPRLASLELCLDGRLSAELIRLLAGHPGATRLKELVLRIPVGQDEARTLVGASSLDGLRRLGIHLSYFGGPEPSGQQIREELGAITLLGQHFGPSFDPE